MTPSPPLINMRLNNWKKLEQVTGIHAAVTVPDTEALDGWAERGSPDMAPLILS